jgi:hypothetical protein
LAEPPLAKGTTLIDLVKMARKQRAAFDALLPDETRALVDSRILAASWYPEPHLRNLLIAADGVLGKGDLALCRTLGRVAARATLESLYKSVVVPGDVLASLRLVSMSWSFMHNTGTVTVEAPSERLVRMTVRDFGLPSLPVCIVFAGWIEGKVEVAGGRAEVVEEKCRLRGQEACVYAIHWTPERLPTTGDPEPARS